VNSSRYDRQRIHSDQIDFPGRRTPGRLQRKVGNTGDPASADRRLAGLLALILAVTVNTFAAPGSVPTADPGGSWSIQPLETVMVEPDGAKAGIDVGIPRCAALGHLDSDGVMDLLVVYEGREGSFAALAPGDPRFRLGPHHDLERERSGLPPERPFARESVLYPLPFGPDFAAIGDWNGDGFPDVVYAGRSRLYWMAGDGRGNLSRGGMIPLEGAVTALAVGEVNRPDGLTDLVLALNGTNGPALLIYEAPEGALQGKPERFPMPGIVRSLAIDRFNRDSSRDIAAAVDSSVIVISGRDRKLPARDRKDVFPAAMASVELGETVLDLAPGRFSGGERCARLAVRLSDGRVRLIRDDQGTFRVSDLGRMPTGGRMMPVHASGLPGDDLLLGERPGREPLIFHQGISATAAPALIRIPAAGLSASTIVSGRLNADTRDDLIMLEADGSIEIAASKSRLSLIVNTTDDTDDGSCNDTHCSLREAINSVNSLPAGSTITFSLPLNSTITVQNHLPTLTQAGAIVIDGTVGAYPITGKLVLEGSSAGTGATGLIRIGGNATLKNLDIRGFDSWAIVLNSSTGNNSVLGCRIGLDAASSTAGHNGGGISVADSGTTIGGTASGEGNIISGNWGPGIEVSGSDAVIIGNIIGLSDDGESTRANRGGISVSASGVQIGSGLSGGGNVVSGNYDFGISLDPDGDAGLIINNIIGLDTTASLRAGNHVSGIVCWSSDSTIGGTAVNLRNIISGTYPDTSDGWGISLYGTHSTEILGNYIGTDINGNSSIYNARSGIVLISTYDTLIGGTVQGAGNVISGNLWQGIYDQGSTNLSIFGNLIGVTADGVSELGNNREGLTLYETEGADIGGTDAPNTIAFNLQIGIEIIGTSTGVDVNVNSIHSNTYHSKDRTAYLGIDLQSDGVSPNDTLDGDSGPNGLQNFPEILSVDPATGSVVFRLHSEASTTYQVLLYSNSNCDYSGYGEGETYLGGSHVVTDIDGNVQSEIDSLSLSPGRYITATATRSDGSTSEFSLCFEVPTATEHIFSDGFESGNTMAWTD